ncbi:hypothetical protein Ddye_025470 [Dipteronia dyeriana]|uniref:Uncharacterized protein n=1 Tax=Dipteronia dyeriana TaxID=168575 RepID=A0AAD9TLF0_9ROSI|nr:hypothetical protein Ddye_025470 [Dipteronia dyeriana]
MDSGLRLYQFDGFRCASRSTEICVLSWVNGVSRVSHQTRYQTQVDAFCTRSKPVYLSMFKIHAPTLVVYWRSTPRRYRVDRTRPVTPQHGFVWLLLVVAFQRWRGHCWPSEFRHVLWLSSFWWLMELGLDGGHES